VSGCALVTGGSRGLGRAVALELARREWSLVGLGCTPGSASGREAAAQVSALGCRAELLEGDLADPAVPGRLVGRFLELSDGRMDLLVNNAGWFSAGRVNRLSEADWDRQVAVNLSAAFRMLRAAGEALGRSAGAVVSVSSLVGFRGAAGAAAYSAAKAGLEALTRTAALEWGGRGVRVNAVIPGFLHETDMGAASTDEYVAGVLALSPLGRPAEVAAAARLIVELGGMSAVTGQVFALEGRVGPPDAPRFAET
jgi:3-oxoacyl-[acyl-carrier protein] reductase